jgi:hypothetical protein
VRHFDLRIAEADLRPAAVDGSAIAQATELISVTSEAVLRYS